MRKLVFDDVFVVKINATVKYTVVVRSLYNYDIIFDRNAIFLFVRKKGI